MYITIWMCPIPLKINYIQVCMKCVCISSCCFFLFQNFECVLHCKSVHVFVNLRNTICEYYMLYKFKLSFAMQRFLRYHKCTCKYKTVQRACYAGYITHTCIYSICLRLSSQVILHLFTSKKRPILIIKRKECEKTQF